MLFHIADKVGWEWRSGVERGCGSSVHGRVAVVNRKDEASGWHDIGTGAERARIAALHATK